MIYFNFILLGLSWGAFLTFSDISYPIVLIIIYLSINFRKSNLNANKYFKKIKMILFFLIPVFLYPFFIGERDAHYLGVGLSLQGFDFSLNIIIRALLVFMTFTFIGSLNFDFKGILSNRFQKVSSFSSLMTKTSDFLPQVNYELIELSKQGKHFKLKSIYNTITEKFAKMILTIYKDK